MVREGGSLTGLYFPMHWPRPERTAFGARGDEQPAAMAVVSP